MKVAIISVISTILVSSTVPAWSHQDIVEPFSYYLNFDFWTGISHPVLGLDHFLAMTSVGILSAQIGGRALWLIPLNFICAMFLGSLLGVTNFNLPSFEFGIAFSVFVLGSLIAADSKTKQSIAWIAVSVFAIFHGYAHGVEMPRILSPIIYVSGFLVGTAIIHFFGVVIGLVFERRQKGQFNLQNTGGVIAATGLLLIVNI